MAGTQNGRSKAGVAKWQTGQKGPGSFRIRVFFVFFSQSDRSGRRAVVHSRIDPPSLAQEELIDRLRRHTKIVPRCPGLLENSGVGRVGGVACVCRSECVCVCVWVRVCPRGTLIGVISALPHDRCRLFTAETSMPTPAWVVNVRHH